MTQEEFMVKTFSIGWEKLLVSKSLSFKNFVFQCLKDHMNETFDNDQQFIKACLDAWIRVQQGCSI